MSAFSLPLLAKELIERAARRRTYVMRVVFALGLYAFFWGENRHRFLAATSPLAMLGQGERMFESLVEMLFVGIYLAVPAMLCGVVSQEKERDSLVLLLLTRLRPWQIVAGGRGQLPRQARGHRHVGARRGRCQDQRLRRGGDSWRARARPHAHASRHG